VFRGIRQAHEQFKHAGNAHDGADSIDTDVVWAQIHSHRPGQQVDRTLAGVVPSQARTGANAAGGADVQDHTLALPAHDGHDSVSHVIDGLHIHVEHAVEHFLIHFQHGLVLVGDGSVVHDNVEGAEFCQTGVNHLLDVFALGNIPLDGQGGAADLGGNA